MRSASTSLFLAVSFAAAASAHTPRICGAAATPLSAEAIGRAAGTQATTAPGGIVRIAWARTDVAVRVDGVRLDPFAGLGSWAAFVPGPRGAMVMGDVVVFQDEVAPAMDAAFAAGLEVTALHNHFLYDEPKVCFMHIGGSGSPDTLAAAVKQVWDAIKKVRAASAQPASGFGGETPGSGNVTAEPLEQILGQKAQTQNGVVKVILGRVARMDGVEVGGSMGLTTWAAFSGNDERAAVDGDFVMTAGEVQPVLHALRKAGILVVALHNHMIGEQPSLYFAHFWATGSARMLASGIRSALDAQAKPVNHAAGH